MAVVDDVLGNPMYMAIAGVALLVVAVKLVLVMSKSNKKGHKGGNQGGVKKTNQKTQKKQEKKKKEPTANDESQEPKDVEQLPSASDSEKPVMEAPPAKKGAKNKPPGEEQAPAKGKKGGKTKGKTDIVKPVEEKEEEEHEEHEEDEEREEEHGQKKGGKTKSKGKNHHAKDQKADKPKQAKVPEPEQNDGIDHSDAAAVGEWETATAIPKKQALRLARKEAEREAEKEAKKMMQQKQVAQTIPGMAAPHVPGSAAAAAAGASKTKAAKNVAEKAEEEQEKAPTADAGLNAVTIKVPEKKIGHVIGPKGSTLELIKEKSGVTRIDTSGEEFTIVGNSKATGIAELAIKEIIEKGYTSLAYENFSSAFVMVHPSFFSELIGKEGCVIRAIKEQLKAEVEIPQGVARTATKKVKVNIAGSSEAVEKAKEVVTDIITVYHHEVTHPGMVHEEIDIDAWAISFVIGKKGSEMRHIQSNFRVKLHLPNEHTINRRAVIVGEPRNVERAKTYIENLIWNAQNQSTGRGRGSDGGAEDYWGEEEEHESWMDAYVYKRR